MLNINAEIIQTIKLNTATVTFNEQASIITLELHSGSIIDSAEVKTYDDATYTLVGDNYYACLVIANSGVELTMDAKKYQLNAQKQQFLVATGIVITSLATRITGNFFLKFSVRKSPIKLFNTETDCKNWLLDQFAQASLKRAEKHAE